MSDTLPPLPEPAVPGMQFSRDDPDSSERGFFTADQMRSYAAAALAAAVAEPLTDEEILRAVSPELWMHIEGERKRQLLLDVRRVLAVAPPQREPLTRQQIDDLMTQHYPLDSLLRENVDAFEACVRDIERALGISAPASVPPHHDPLTDAADAARFRWLAEHTSATGLERWVHPFQFLREAVDERMRAPASAPKEQE